MFGLTTLFLFSVSLFLIFSKKTQSFLKFHINKLFSNFSPILSMSNPPLLKKDKINWSLAIITIGFVLITFYFYYRGIMLALNFPFNTFLPGPVTRFGDFYVVNDQWTRMHFNGVGFGLSYFPATYLIAELLSHIHPPQSALTFLLTIFFAYLFFYTYKHIKCEGDSAVLTFKNTFILTFMTYPVIFAAHTGNFEIFIFIFLSLFVWLYQAGKVRFSLIPLSFAISMKVFPALFVVLLLSDKKYKEIVYLLVWIVFFTVTPLLLFHGGFDIGIDNYLKNLIASQKMYKDLMIMSSSGNAFGHSLINSSRIIMGGLFPPMDLIILPYLIFSIIFLAFISTYIIFIEKTFWKKVALLVTTMCLLPFTSTDYKLISFLIPLYLFFISREDDLSKFNIIYTILFSILLIPKNYLYLRGDPFCSLNNISNTVIMLTIMYFIISSNCNSILSVYKRLRYSIDKKIKSSFPIYSLKKRREGNSNNS